MKNEKNRSKPEGGLASLIERRRREHNESYGDIAKRAGVSKPYIYKLATTDGPTGMPRAATITALARGLQTTEDAVRDAALISAEMVTQSLTTRDPRVEAIVASLEGLDDRDLLVVQRLVDSLQDEEVDAG